MFSMTKFKLNWRFGIILVGILQFILHIIITGVLVLTLKVSLIIRKKQLADLEDHGADMNHLNHLPETNDLMKLWDAKNQNDVKIDISTFCIILNTFYAISCATTAYGTIIKNKVVLAVGVFCCIMSLCVLTTVIFVGYCFYTNLYFFQLKEEGLKLIEENGKLVGIIIAYSVFALSVHHAALLYCMKLHGKPLLTQCHSRTNSVQVNHIQDTESLRTTNTSNPLKVIVRSIKFIHHKFESTKPTEV